MKATSMLDIIIIRAEENWMVCEEGYPNILHISHSITRQIRNFHSYCCISVVPTTALLFTRSVSLRVSPVNSTQEWLAPELLREVLVVVG
jgi:hypothetical protein